MESLWKYYKEENWQYILEKVVPVEFHKNKRFYDEISEERIFSDDLYKVLATFSEYMFHHSIDEYKSWLKTKQKMLDDYTPIEILHKPKGVETLKEYLLRYPKI